MGMDERMNPRGIIATYDLRPPQRRQGTQPPGQGFRGARRLHGKLASTGVRASVENALLIGFCFGFR